LRILRHNKQDWEEFWKRQNLAGVSFSPQLNEDELDDFGTWLEAGLPALYEPQQNHPWVQILGALSHGALKV